MAEKFYSKGELAKYLNITRPTLDAKINKLEEQGISVELNKIRDKDTGKDYFRPEDVERLVKLMHGEIDNSFTDEKQKELDSLTSKVKELERQVNVKDERIKELGEELEKVRSELEESKELVKTLSESVKSLSDTVKLKEIRSLPPAKETREGLVQRIKHFFLGDGTVNTFTSNDSVKDDK